MRDLVALTLTKCGASVTFAASVKDALGLMPNLTPDVVVSDIAMPEVDGYEFIQRLRALAHPKGSDIPAIALTAYASAQDRNRALEQGFDLHLTKPVDPAQLLRAIVQSQEARAARRLAALARMAGHRGHAPSDNHDGTERQPNPGRRRHLPKRLRPPEHNAQQTEPSHGDPAADDRLWRHKNFAGREWLFGCGHTISFPRLAVARGACKCQQPRVRSPR